MSGSQLPKIRRIAAVVALVIAGEAVFGLPFHIARYFRPTFLAAFGLTNTELGLLFSAYGVLAMICYVPGGPLADRFSARRLLAVSLGLTGAMGLYLATMPDVGNLSFVYGFFGVTTILLFWAAMIRATRDSGGAEDQGKAFGTLDAGRGGVAASLALIAQIPFAMALGEDPSQATDAQRVEAIRAVIYVYTMATFLAAGVVWVLVPDSQAESAGVPQPGFQWRHMAHAFRQPSIWLQALVVVCAYTAYKGIDNYSLFAYDAYGMDEVEASRLASLTAWVRVFAAFGAGWIADRVDATRATAGCFGLLVVGYAVLALTRPDPAQPLMLWMNVVVTCAAIFGLRGVYFALMDEVQVPSAVTGTAVGLISFVGFTPDIFAGAMSGWILDRSPGVAGHQHLFMVLAAFALIGLCTALVLRRYR